MLLLTSLHHSSAVAVAVVLLLPCKIQATLTAEQPVQMLGTQACCQAASGVTQAGNPLRRGSDGGLDSGLPVRDITMHRSSAPGEGSELTTNNIGTCC